MTERRVRIIAPWIRHGQAMHFETLCGYVVAEHPRPGGGTLLTLRIPIWGAPHNTLVVPASCVEDAPLRRSEPAA